MDHKTAKDTCSLCGKGKEEWEGAGISIENGSFCSEQCARTKEAGTYDSRRPTRAVTEMEKKDAYDSNDGQPPLDEAPVEAGGSRKQD
jgi:hypothetical protein